MSLKRFLLQKKAPIITALFCCLVLIIILFSHNYGFQTYTKMRYFFWQHKIPKELSKSEYISVIVLSEQRNYIFKNGKFIKRYIVATGSKTRYESDRTLRQGVWRLKDRLDHDLESLYGPRLIYMEYYNRYKKEFVKTRKAFHGTDEPGILGKPMSMGCVYHSNRDIIEIYDMLPDNTLVIVTKY